MALGSAQCGLLASPGEYGTGAIEVADAAPEGSGSSDGMTPPNDATTLPDGFVVPMSIGTIAVMAGEREPTSPEDDPAWSADAWSGILAADGSVATWRIEKSAPIVGSFDSAGLVGKTWVMINIGFGIGGTRGTAIQSTSWAPGVVGDWKAARANGAPGGLDEYSRGFYGAHVFYIGGTRTNAGVDGGPPTTFFTKEAHSADVDATKPELGASADSGVTLVNARSRAGLAFKDDVAFVVGGRSPGGITSSVETAKVAAATGTLQAFAAQPTMMNAGAEHRVFLPGVVAESHYLFVAGGHTNLANAPTDVVLSAKINADGTISDFQSCTHLPRALRDFAFVGFKGRLYVAGGIGASGRTDEVYSAAIGADGKLSAWQANAKLPAARSDFVALAY